MSTPHRVCSPRRRSTAFMDTSPAAVLGLGFALGLRHALDADHLAAVSTMLSERRGVAAATLTGAVWGLGHTAALLAVAVPMIALHAQVPPQLNQLLELGVATMLVVLGVNLLRNVARGGELHAHVHEHDGRRHTHLHLHAPGDAHDPAVPHAAVRKPFLVGMVHGLAGSGAVMLTVLATISSPALAVAYVLLFGLGSVGGMAALSLLVGVPMALAAHRLAASRRLVRVCAAVGSVVVGTMLAWDIGVAAGVLQL